MFAHHSQNYFIEAVALWISFMPALAVLAMIIAAQAVAASRQAIPAHRRAFSALETNDFGIRNTRRVGTFIDARPIGTRTRRQP